MTEQEHQNRIVEIEATATHDLRRRVLRSGTPSAELEWIGDLLASTVHLAVTDRTGQPIAISTWLAVLSPDVDEPNSSGFQLRGMATDPDVRATGVGTILLDAGIARVQTLGANHVWANARTAVLGFYTRAGFEIVSDEFLSVDTAIPHRRILLRFD